MNVMKYFDDEDALSKAFLGAYLKYHNEGTSKITLRCLLTWKLWPNYIKTLGMKPCPTCLLLYHVTKPDQFAEFLDIIISTPL